MLVGIRARRRAGFTLAELLVVLAILALLAGILYPTVMGQLRQGQTAALANQLNALRTALANYDQNVTFYPRQLTQLTTQPANFAVTSCNPGTLPNNQHLSWRGPYIQTDIQATGLPVGDAMVQNAIVRNPLTTAVTQAGLLEISVFFVDNDIATELEQQYDGNANFATGTILWVAAGSSGTLTFRVPIRGC